MVEAEVPQSTFSELALLHLWGGGKSCNYKCKDGLFFLVVVNRENGSMV